MPLFRLMPLWLLLASSLHCAEGLAATSADTPWQIVTTSDDSTAVDRHEAAAVVVDGLYYLLGGRSARPVEVYDPVSNRWRVIGDPPMELHHFQPVAIGSKIYALAAFTCCYPDEPSVSTIYVFDTVTETWSTDGTMPSGRVRGSAAAVVFDGEIYVLGGNTKGHAGGAVNWFDRYDPVSKDWDILPNAPHARDHFAAVVVDGRLVAAAGRTTEQPNPFTNAVKATDIYNFSTNTWSVGKDIPTVRAGALAAAAGNEVLVAGGEINTSSEALSTTEAYDVTADSWRSLKSLNTGRHSGGGAVIGSQWHLVAGSNVTGGGGEMDSHEMLELGTDTDSDGDGLIDVAETSIYNTDPLDPDSDGDGANDGDEVDAGSDPNQVDSDDDGLSDGEEINTHGTSPVIVDTDEDGLGDGAEVLIWESDPLKRDSDDDGLADADEVERGTDINVADSDSDGLSDSEEIIAGTDPLKSDTDDDGLNDSEDPEPLTPQSVEPTEPVEPTNPTEPTDPTTPVEPTEPTEVVTGGNGGGALTWLLAVLAIVGVNRRRRISGAIVAK
ncbi:Kelch repeat-containing protein [Granulosicoccus antarcticus]|uniref:N-acetylneuraminate epimerase n=1 Tax=Granulosicoccus antarcticus IMCC3135 TaxID=1192854 RepID=A0A2Z2NWB0_9GAMM|nr:kelch motif-containing protein [Granulosicoccus antarcticus]ASJ75629.1 N-acetylneuraminate epimerase [Granulosicoccus antarcticus IMCC3135]